MTLLPRGRTKMGVAKDSKKGGQNQRGRGKSSKGAEETQRGVKFSGRGKQNARHISSYTFRKSKIYNQHTT